MNGWGVHKARGTQRLFRLKMRDHCKAVGEVLEESCRKKFGAESVSD
jgi:hypothetical protein